MIRGSQESSCGRSPDTLRLIFESLPDPTAEDSEVLVWSSEEKPDQKINWIDKCGRSQTTLITDLEAWFRAFGDVRNKIIHIHKGKRPQLTYSGPNPAYDGPFFSTAEFLLRGVIKVLLASKPGYEDIWRSQLWRCASQY